MSTAGGIGARSGFASGMNSPTVTLEGLRYASATRCTSAGGDRAIAVALQEEQAPVAERDRFGDRDAELLRIGDHVVEVLGRLRAHALDLGVGDRLLLRGPRSWRTSRRAPARSSSPSGICAKNVSVPGSCCASCHSFDRRRLLGFDQRLVQAARRARPSGRRPARRWRRSPGARRAPCGTSCPRNLELPDAAQRHRALAVLHRLHRVDRRQRARRLRDRAEVLRDQRRASRPASNLPATISTALSGW